MDKDDSLMGSFLKRPQKSHKILEPCTTYCMDIHRTVSPLENKEFSPQFSELTLSSPTNLQSPPPFPTEHHFCASPLIERILFIYFLYIPYIERVASVPKPFPKLHATSGAEIKAGFTGHN